MPTKPQHAATYRLLPAFLRALREEAGLTQRDLGRRLRKPHSYVCAYNPSDGLARLYCEFVAARALELLGSTISQAEAHAWLRQHRPASAALLDAVEAGIPLPREVPIGQFPIDPMEAGPQSEIAAHLTARGQLRNSQEGDPDDQRV